MSFQGRYSATPFDPNNRRDARSERARKLLVSTFLSSIKKMDAKTGEDVQDILGGLLVGLIGITMRHMADSDEAHAALRASIIQLTPWAVDLLRDMDGRPPLSDRN